MSHKSLLESTASARWQVEQARHAMPCQAESRLSAALAILRMAAALEPDHVEAMVWYRNDPIAVIDGLTAAELVARGRATAVLAFLRAAIEVEAVEAQCSRFG
jgi:hypothetical protein